jgi:hypothetical protein
MTLLSAEPLTRPLPVIEPTDDNFKGVATLYRANVADYKTTITVATLATFAGCIASVFLAHSHKRRTGSSRPAARWSWTSPGPGTQECVECCTGRL